MAVVETLIRVIAALTLWPGQAFGQQGALALVAIAALCAVALASTALMRRFGAQALDGTWSTRRDGTRTSEGGRARSCDPSAPGHVRARAPGEAQAH